MLAGVRFSVDGRRLDLLLCGGFSAAAASMLVFTIAPVLGGGDLPRTAAWAGAGGRLFAWSLIAAAPFSRRRSSARGLALGEMLLGVALVLALSWGIAAKAGASLPSLSSGRGDDQPLLLMISLAARALLALTAMVGFGLRFRARGNDLDRWLCLGATLALFAELHYLFTPMLSGGSISQGDFLRLLSYSVLLVGVWRAIRHAEFGRAVAEERARVAREIHDGLAQYLFAVSTHASMLENGADPERTLAQLKDAAAAAQQEARFAVLALSSAGGSAPFDSALRRYVDFLTADGRLEVDLEIAGRDPARARRADRGLPHRPGGARQRPQARGCATRRGADRGARRRALRHRRGRWLGLRRAGDRGRTGPEEHARPGRLDRRRLPAESRLRGAERRWKSSCARNLWLRVVFIRA